MFRALRPLYCIITVAASAFLAFGLYHIHALANVTEGGVLGLTLLLDHWFHISPSVSGFVLNAACYAFGWRTLGRNFIYYSALSSAAFSVSYAVCEQFPPLWPQLYDAPLLAAVLGAVFVGLGAGFCVRVGGATGGDDALAMAISHLTGWKLQWIYLVSDLLVLGLSATYIPLSRLGYSLLTVILSGQIVGFVQHIPLPESKEDPEKTE